MFSSKDYEQFKKSCFPKTFEDWHDGLDVNALLNLSGFELWQAQRLILRGIKNEIGKSRNNAIDAAGFLKLKPASELLKSKLEQFNSSKKNTFITVKIAWALYQIERYSNSPEIIISYIQSQNKTDKLSFDLFRSFKYLVSLGDEPQVISFLESLASSNNVEEKLLRNLATTALENIRMGKRSPYGKVS